MSLTRERFAKICAEYGYSEVLVRLLWEAPPDGMPHISEANEEGIRRVNQSIIDNDSLEDFETEARQWLSETDSP